MQIFRGKNGRLVGQEGNEWREGGRKGKDEKGFFKGRTMIFCVQSFALLQASPPIVSCLQVVTVTPPSLVPDRIDE